MVAVVGIIVAVALHSLALVSGYLATFLPGLAVLQFAAAGKSGSGKIAGLLLLAAPLIVVAAGNHRFLDVLKDDGANFAYALCFFPGLLAVLRSIESERPHLGFFPCIAYLFVLLIITSTAGVADSVYAWPAGFALLGLFGLAALDNVRSPMPGRISGVVLLCAAGVLSLIRIEGG